MMYQMNLTAADVNYNAPTQTTHNRRDMLNERTKQTWCCFFITLSFIINSLLEKTNLTHNDPDRTK